MSGPTPKLLLVFILLAALSEWHPACAQRQDHTEASELTSQRLRGQGWWPTRADEAREEFAGTAACAVCHEQVAVTQRVTPMAHAASKASETEILAIQTHTQILHTAIPNRNCECSRLQQLHRLERRRIDQRPTSLVNGCRSQRSNLHPELPRDNLRESAQLFSIDWWP